jgi:hypothetical protein
MVGISDSTEDSLLNLIFRSQSWSGYATNDATQTNIGIALHTADPTDAGTATTNEVTTGAYVGYARVNVPRGTGTPGWSAPTSEPRSISPTANVDFPVGTGGTGASVTHFSTSSSNGTPPTGPAVILWSGTVAPGITVGSGVTPRLTTLTTITLT